MSDLHDYFQDQIIQTDQGLEFLSRLTQPLLQTINKLQLIISKKDRSLELTEPLISTRTLERKLQKNTFINIKDLKIFVPPGLSVSAFTHAQTLDQAVATNEKLLINILNPLQRYLAIVLTDINLVNQHSLHISLKDFQSNSTEKMHELIGKSFNKGSTQVEKPLKEVYSNLNEMKKTYQLMDQVIARYNSISYQGIKDQITLINQYLNKVIYELEHSELTEFKGIDRLSQYTFTTALEVEFYGIVGYHLTSFISSLNRTYEKI